MANSYWNSPGDFVAGTLVKAEDANTKFNGVESGFEAVEAAMDQAIQVTAVDAGVVDISATVAARAGNVLSFDVNGDLTASEGAGAWQGDHADAAGTDYSARDYVKDAAGALKLDSIYVCIESHTSTGDLAADTAYWAEVIDMTDVKASETAAAASASAADGSATTASGHADTANEWADKTTGFVSGSDNSAKSWAVGGTGDGEPAAGNAKDWATQVTTEVDGSDFSAKEYAVGTSVAAGSSKNWATKVDGAVSGTDHSAQAWAIGGTGVTDTAGKGPAKEWAINPEDETVDGTNYSALHWAAKSATSAASFDIYDIAFNLTVVTSGAGNVLASFTATRAFTIAASLAGCQGYAQTAPSGGDAVFTVMNNGVDTVGTFTFADGVSTDTLAGAGDTINIGDVITIESAASMYSISGVSLTLKGALA